MSRQPKSSKTAKSQKIDLRQPYPCPICQGKLQVIALTDALGCDRCNLMFVVADDGYGMNQVAVSSKTWYWHGDQWKIDNRVIRENQHFAALAVIRFILIVGVVIVLCLLSKTPEFVLGFTLIILLMWISWRFLPHSF